MGCRQVTCASFTSMSRSQKPRVSRLQVSVHLLTLLVSGEVSCLGAGLHGRRRPGHDECKPSAFIPTTCWYLRQAWHNQAKQAGAHLPPLPSPLTYSTPPSLHPSSIIPSPPCSFHSFCTSCSLRWQGLLCLRHLMTIDGNLRVNRCACVCFHELRK
jgi:hypothetical protein